ARVARAVPGRRDEPRGRQHAGGVMDWKQLGEAAVKLGLPLLGAALPVPGGAALGAALASALGAPRAEPGDILATLGDSVLKARQFELTHQARLMQMALDYEVKVRQADTADIAAVNETMRAEAQQSAVESWWQKGWRPFNGYVLGLASLIAVIFV